MPSIDYGAEPACFAERRRRWMLIDDLLGGTLQMRRVATRWLPQEPKEEDDKYKARLNRSVLFEAFKDTIRKHSAKPFSREIEYTDVPTPLEYLKTDCDRRGTTLFDFARRGFTQGLTYGAAHIFVDFPTAPPEVTLKEIEDKKLRPYLTLVHPKTVVKQTMKYNEATGTEELVMVRMKYCEYEIDENFAEVEITYVKILRIGSWEVYRLTTDSNGTSWQRVRGGETRLTFIPFVTVPFDEEGSLEPFPPMEGLAWLNLLHYQSSSDQTNILRIARCGLLFFSGMTDDDMEKETVIGPNQVFKTTNPDATGEFIEYSGSSIQCGERHIKWIEDQMEILGLQPLLKSASRVSATSKASDENNSDSLLQSWARRMGRGLTQAFMFAGKYSKTPTKPSMSVQLFTDFGISLFTAVELSALQSARENGDISRKEFRLELQRRGLVDEHFNALSEEGLPKEDLTKPIVKLASNPKSVRSGNKEMPVKQ